MIGAEVPRLPFAIPKHWLEPPLSWLVLGESWHRRATAIQAGYCHHGEIVRVIRL